MKLLMVIDTEEDAGGGSVGIREAISAVVEPLAAVRFIAPLPMGRVFEKWLIISERTKNRYSELYEEAKDIVRAEAIKEFAERLKADGCSFVAVENGRELYETKSYQISAVRLDCLVKEMTGGKQQCRMN